MRHRQTARGPRPALAMMVGAAVALSGCGGASLSTGQLRSQAGPICQTAERQAARIATPASPAQAPAFLTAGSAVVAAELARLRALSPNAAAAAVYQGALSALSRQLALVRDAARAMRGGEDPVMTMKSLQQELGPPQAQADADWRKLGITACVTR